MKKEPEMTYADRLNLAMAITNEPHADLWLRTEVRRCRAEKKMTLARALEIQRGNLGYYAGYFSNETRARVERLFKCEHPIFGAIAVKGAPTPEEAFAMGVKAGSKARLKAKK